MYFNHFYSTIKVICVLYDKVCLSESDVKCLAVQTLPFRIPMLRNSKLRFFSRFIPKSRQTCAF